MYWCSGEGGGEGGVGEGRAVGKGGKFANCCVLWDREEVLTRADIFIRFEAINVHFLINLLASTEPNERIFIEFQRFTCSML